MSRFSNLLLFLIVVGIFGAAYILLLPPTWIIDKQIGAIRSGDIPKAYEYTSEDFQNKTSLVDFTTFINNFPILQDSQGMAINEELIDQETNHGLIVRATLKNSEGKQIPIEYSIIRSNNIQGMLKGWKIQTIKIQDQGEWKALPLTENQK